MFSRRFLTRNFAKQVTKKTGNTSKGGEAPVITVDMLRKSKHLDFNITQDLYRIDLGMLIERPAIYLPLENVEVDKLNTDSHFFFKHGLRYQFNPALTEFSQESPLADSNRKDINNMKTHSRKNEDGTTTFYAENSKLYDDVDPTI